MDRVLAAATLGVLGWALVSPTHVLGDTAVYGRAYLWGESSSRANAGREILWFVDRWEIAQHVLFAAAAILCALALISGRWVVLVALALAGLVGLAFQRSSAGGESLPLFVVIVMWSLLVSIASVWNLRKGARRSGGARRPAALGTSRDRPPGLCDDRGPASRAG